MDGGVSGIRSAFAIAIGLGLMAFGLLVTGIGTWSCWDQLKVSFWDRVPCLIERFEITADSNSRPPFGADLLFHYQVGERKLTGSTLRRGFEGTDDYEFLAELRETLVLEATGDGSAAVGKTASNCRVDPKDPGKAVLLTGSMGKIWLTLLAAITGVGVMLAGVSVIVGGRDSALFRLLSLRRTGGSQSRGSSRFGWLFIVAAIVVLFAVIVPKSLEWLAMRSWKEVPGEVVWSRLETSRGKRSKKGSGTRKTYSAEVFYRYSFAGREYHSNRYGLIRSTSSGKSSSAEFVRNHPKGTALQVWADPGKPWRAVVKRNPGSGALLILFPVVFGLVGYVILRPSPLDEHRSTEP